VSWLAERRAALTVAAPAKWILLRLLGGHRPELGEVAKDLGMSIRILQRRITKAISPAIKEMANPWKVGYDCATHNNCHCGHKHWPKADGARVYNGLHRVKLPRASVAHNLDATR
jgi:hypothetical protein